MLEKRWYMVVDVQKKAAIILSQLWTVKRKKIT